MRRRFFSILLPWFLVALPLAAQTTDSLTRDQRWRADLQFLAHELPARHKNAFATTTAAALDSAVHALDARIPQLSDGQAVFELSRIVASLRDSHTGLGVDGAAKSMHMLPLGVTWLDDGIFITAFDSAHAALAGSRIVSINGIPVETAARRLAPYLSWDNEATMRQQVAARLTFAELLELAGIGRSTDDFTITTENEQGRHSTKLQAVSLASGGVRARSVFASVPRPLYLSNERANYWYQLLDDRTLYFQYNRCSNDRARPFQPFAAELLAVMDSAKVTRLVVDLRLNGGGNSFLMYGLLQGVKNWLGKTPGAKLYVLTSARTFSSAVINAAELKQAGAVVVGQPTGGRPNHFGEVRTMQLPNSKLIVAYSTNYFETLPGYEHDSIMPDIPVPLISTDLFAGKDAALTRVLAN